MSPSLAGGAKHRDFTVNHGVFITFSPIIQFSTETIAGAAAPQTPKMIRTFFAWFAKKFVFLLMDAFETPDIIRTHLHSTDY